MEKQADGNVTGERVKVNLWNCGTVLNIIGYFNGVKISYPNFLDKIQKASQWPKPLIQRQKQVELSEFKDKLV